MKFFLKHIRFIAHVAFWLGYFFVVCYTFSRVFNLEVVIARSAIIGAFHIPVVYFHLYVLLPKLFKNKKYLAYCASVIGLIVFTIPLKTFVVFTVFGDYFGQVEVEEDFPIVINNIISSSVLLIITTGLWYAEQGIINLRVREELKRVKLESELQLLRNQINPHFLFNVLNNIYSLSYTGSKKAPEAILKLSEMLRYMLYDSQNDRVALSEEVAYLNNYIELQRVKSGDAIDMSFLVQGATESVNVPPLLFIPFFENAAKHGELDRRKDGYFRAKLLIDGANITFKCENPVKRNDANQLEPGGIGLTNVRSRLNLIFPETYELGAAIENGVFKVDLKIQRR